MSAIRLRLTAVVLIVLAMVGACALLPDGGLGTGSPGPGGLPYPDGCAAFGFSDNRCAKVVHELARQEGVDFEVVREVRLLPDPGCGQGPDVLCARTASLGARARFTLADGTTRDAVIWCGVGSQGLFACSEAPEVWLMSPTMNGYGDIPCSGEAPDGCASPVPSVDPAALAQAVALRIPSLEVAVDHAGRYEIALGRATLPNGVLTEAVFALADAHEAGFELEDGRVSLTVRSTADGTPLLNRYDHGWREGVEVVEAVLVFTVVDYDPGAIIPVRDIVVR
jgi:hypothetical protein